MPFETVIVCYGDQLGYHHGAKYQILRSIGENRTQIGHCVITDKPHLFDGYPCRILELTTKQASDWSVSGLNHFGIKMRSFHWAITTGSVARSILLDTDMFWNRSPRKLEEHIQDRSVVLYQNEGQVIGSKNRSIQQFQTGLSNALLSNRGKPYRLDHAAEMWGSAIVGMKTSQADLILEAYDLFVQMAPLVQAHTVEQFALSEVLRLRGFNRYEGKKFVSNWSSIGKKNYATVQLQNFFNKYGETDFEAHLRHWREIQIHRPLGVLLSQKVERWKKKYQS